MISSGSDRRFRFAVQFANARSRAEWTGKAQIAEQLGYSAVVVPDHLGRQLAPWPALLLAAEATESIRVGTFVLDNDFRHPLVLAQEAASVDLLTEGRLELGLGAGWLGVDYRRAGLPFESPRVRRERLEEAVDILQAYFGGEPFSFDGHHYQLADVEPGVRPGRRRRPPLLIGGGGPRLLAFAARRADIISVFLRSRADGSGFELAEASPAAFDAKIAHIRKEAGERFSEIELNVLVQHVEITRDRRAAAEEPAKELGTSVDDVLELPFELIGTHDQLVEDLVARRERYGISYITVFERHFRDFAPVVESLAGS